MVLSLTEGLFYRSPFSRSKEPVGPIAGKADCDLVTFNNDRNLGVAFAVGQHLIELVGVFLDIVVYRLVAVSCTSPGAVRSGIGAVNNDCLCHDLLPPDDEV